MKGIRLIDKDERYKGDYISAAKGKDGGAIFTILMKEDVGKSRLASRTLSQAIDREQLERLHSWIGKALNR